MPSPAPQRKRLYTLLNIGWRQLGWTEIYYRENCLANHGATAANGKISATSMTDAQLEKALAQMKADGFVPTSGKRTRAKPTGSGQGKQPATAEQVQLVRAIWADLQQLGAVRSTDPASLRTWLLKNSRRHHPQGTGWSEPQFMTRGAAAKAIEQLKNWQARARR